MSIGDSEQARTVNEKSKAGWLTTKRRITIVIVVLVVLAIALIVGNQLVKSEETAVVAVTEPITSVEISVGAGAVTLSDSAQLSVSRTAHYVIKKPDVSAKVDEGVLKLKSDCGGLRIGECAVDYSVAVPANIPVLARSSSGSVNIRGLKSDVQVDTKSAHVDIENAYGRVVAKTTSGGVDGSAISSRNISVQASSGSVNLEFAASPSNVEATSESGAVTISLPKSSTAYNVDASSQSGKTVTDVQRDANSPYSVRARSESGAVTVEAKS